MTDSSDPPRFPVPQVVPVTTWPPEVRGAVLELIAFAANRDTPMLVFEAGNLTHEGAQLGSYRITIERTDT